MKSIPLFCFLPGFGGSSSPGGSSHQEAVVVTGKPWETCVDGGIAPCGIIVFLGGEVSQVFSARFELRTVNKTSRCF